MGLAAGLYRREASRPVRDGRRKKEVPRARLAFLFLFLLGAGIRAVDVWHPVDRPSWRECDIASISRNYYREGMNLFYPRIDWRGEGPGYAEMEFPLYPWLIALLYRLWGYHEVAGRLLAYLFSLATIVVFFKLARYLLPLTGAIIASLFFVLSPLAITISTALQSEGLMFLTYLLAAYAFVRWLDKSSWRDYGVALVATALSILAKATAAHIGLLFAILVLRQMGIAAIRQIRIWFFAIASLLPGLLWYAHAHRLWLAYGNSLGVSNEYHWAGWDLFTNPNFVVDIGRSEALYVWMPAGVIVAILGVWLRRYETERAVSYSLLWLAAILVYYLIIARTSGDDWAVYYHIVSLPPVALLIGVGGDVIGQIKLPFRLLTTATFSLGIIAMLSGAIGVLSLLGGWPVFFPSISNWTVKIAGVSGLAALVLIVILLDSSSNRWGEITKERPLLSGLVVAASLLTVLCITFLSQVRQVLFDLYSSRRPSELYTCAQKFARFVPQGALILASGGTCKDPTGYPVAYNASYMFYWMDRKGFNICEEEQSLEAIAAFAERGAKYFVAEKKSLSAKPGLEVQLRNALQVVSECEQAILFQLPQSVMVKSLK